MALTRPSKYTQLRTHTVSPIVPRRLVWPACKSMQSRGMNSCPTRTMRTRRRIGISSAPIRCSSWSIAHGRRVFNAYNGRSMCVWSADAIPCGVTCRLRVSSFRSLLDSACVYQLGTSFLKLRVPALRFYLARHPTRTSPVPIPPWSTNTSSARYTTCRVQRQCVRYWGVHVQAQPSPTWRTFGLRHIQSGSLRPEGRPIFPVRLSLRPRTSVSVFFVLSSSISGSRCSSCTGCTIQALKPRYNRVKNGCHRVTKSFAQALQKRTNQ